MGFVVPPVTSAVACGAVACVDSMTMLPPNECRRDEEDEESYPVKGIEMLPVKSSLAAKCR